MVVELRIEREPLIQYQCEKCLKQWYTKQFAKECEDSHKSRTTTNTGDAK